MTYINHKKHKSTKKTAMALDTRNPNPKPEPDYKPKPDKP